MVQEAVDGHGFELAFQPIVAVAGGDDAQYQTLARMRDRDGRLYTAAEFLPAADAAGLLHRIDHRVLELALDAMQRRLGEGRAIRLFVTQSARSLTRDGYAAELLALLASKGIEGPSLVVDVRQEDALIHALSLQEFCSAMVPAGVQLCLSQYRPDDEARALLAQLPLGYVRLSARYSSGLDDAQLRDEMREAIEQAHRLGLQVIGQQVEDPQAAATLWMSGVDFIQGNLVQRAAGGLDFDFQHSVL
jgi:EAL domain-containing protein (putative c-di-GMP-specific phosphodiesterase class I)